MFVCSYKRCQVENVPPKKPPEIPKGRGGGVHDYGILRAWGNAFWNFRRQGGLKHGSHPCLGMDIFWNCPMAELDEILRVQKHFSSHFLLIILIYLVRALAILCKLEYPLMLGGEIA